MAKITVFSHQAHGLTKAQLTAAAKDLHRQIQKHGLQHFVSDFDGIYHLSVEFPSFEVDFETLDGLDFEVLSVNDL